VLVREISKTAPAGKEHTKLRERERKKLQQIATLKKIVPSMVNSIPRGEKKKKQAAMFAALANAIDYSSRAHTDEDFWFSLLTVNVPEAGYRTSFCLS
jgi:transcriptional regulator with XRE-family HTH domain